MAVIITSSPFDLTPNTSYPKCALHLPPSPPSLDKHPSHLPTSCSRLHIHIFLPPSLSLRLFILLYLCGACLTAVLCVFFSLDLSELAKAAKKKLQAVSWVELWDLNHGLLYVYATILQTMVRIIKAKVTVLRIDWASFLMSLNVM